MANQQSPNYECSSVKYHKPFNVHPRNFQQRVYLPLNFMDGRLESCDPFPNWGFGEKFSGAFAVKCPGV